MRSLVLSIGSLILVIGVAWAQTSGGGNSPTIPYGQTFKDFQFPLYQDGQLKATLSAVSAKGTTLNRAETTDLKIELYDTGKTTASTIITSPKADIYLADRRMRTKNTVLIARDDMEVTAQSCDFDLLNKKYYLHDNVRVTLKNFDASFKTPPAPAPATPGASVTPASAPAPSASNPSANSSPLDTPGAYANTNLAPTPPPSPVHP